MFNMIFFYIANINHHVSKQMRSSDSVGFKIPKVRGEKMSIKVFTFDQVTGWSMYGAAMVKWCSCQSPCSSHWAHDFGATLNQRHWCWFNIATKPCAQWVITSVIAHHKSRRNLWTEEQIAGSFRWKKCRIWTEMRPTLLVFSFDVFWQNSIECVLITCAAANWHHWQSRTRSTPVHTILVNLVYV